MSLVENHGDIVGEAVVIHLANHGTAECRPHGFAEIAQTYSVAREYVATRTDKQQRALGLLFHINVYCTFHLTHYFLYLTSYGEQTV